MLGRLKKGKSMISETLGRGINIYGFSPTNSAKSQILFVPQGELAYIPTPKKASSYHP